MKWKIKSWGRTWLSVWFSLFAACLAAVAFGQAPTATSVAKPAAPVDGKQLLQDMINALGGPAYLGVKNVVTNGRIYEIREGQTVGTTVYRDFIEYPDRVRTEIGEKRELILINNRLKGWIVEKGVTRDQTGQEVLEFLKTQQHDFDTLIRWRIQREPYEVKVGDEVTIDKTKTRELDLVFPGVETIRLFIDENTKLPAQFSYEMVDTSAVPAAPTGTPAAPPPRITQDVTLWNYHLVAGVMVPFHASIAQKGKKVVDIVIEEVKFNTRLDNTVFSQPETPKRNRR
ncbi:MAG: hypothetical protein PHX83_11650 [Acidobacteriia bacterium]|nr:hypothetical protein [Terriglobia bacterium]